MRRCFFIFDYAEDLARARKVAELGIARATAIAGFEDAARLEEALAQGPQAVEALIDEAIAGTSVSLVLIGAHTAERDYVNAAISRSIRHGNGILGVYVDTIEDDQGRTTTRGPIPGEAEAAAKLDAHGYAVREYDPAHLGEWLEQAATEWKIYARPAPLNKAGR